MERFGSPKIKGLTVQGEYGLDVSRKEDFDVSIECDILILICRQVNEVSTNQMSIE